MRGFILCVLLGAAACGQIKESPKSTNAPAEATADAAVRAGEITISEAWAPVTPSGGRVAAGYLVITNEGPDAETLTAVSSMRAKQVQMHEMLEENGMMTMRELPQVTIKPGETVSFEAGHLHLMLVEPQLPYSEGEEVPVVLTFKNAGAVTIPLKVKQRAPETGSQNASDGHEMH